MSLYIAACRRVSTAKITIRHTATLKIKARLLLKVPASVATPAEANAIGPMLAKYW